MKFWEHAQESFHQATEEPIFDAWLFCVLRYLTQAPVLRVNELWCMGMCPQKRHNEINSLGTDAMRRSHLLPDQLPVEHTGDMAAVSTFLLQHNNLREHTMFLNSPYCTSYNPTIW